VTKESEFIAQHSGVCACEQRDAHALADPQVFSKKNKNKENQDMFISGVSPPSGSIKVDTSVV
jgi:hypothetical protein